MLSGDVSRANVDFCQIRCNFVWIETNFGVPHSFTPYTRRTQVSGKGRRGRLLPRGAFLPGPGLPSEEGLREREILGVTLL